MSFEVRTIPSFEKQFKKLHKKYPSLKADILNLIKELETNAFVGTSLGKDFYKIRLSITSKSKGKSGGARIISCVKIVRRTVYFAAIYDESEISSINDTDLKLLASKIG